MGHQNIWLSAMMGLVVGDALGVPVQFMTRDEIRNRAEGPVTGMESGGVFDMPKGTWSDDSSMALATLVSILESGTLVPEQVMVKFCLWEVEGEFTPFGEAFDQGLTCSEAIYRFLENHNVNTCGKTGVYANGNGALMRILPACLYYYETQKRSPDDGTGDVIKGLDTISGLTHNHLRSKIACGLYYFMVREILDTAWQKKEQSFESPGNFETLEGPGGQERPGNFETLEGLGGQERPGSSGSPDLMDILQKGIDAGRKFYGANISNLTEMAHFGRLFYLSEFGQTEEDSIGSGGYVVESLEAAVWCLIRTNTFRDCLLKAVNLGDDTDTVAAIAGGLAGLYYGYENIPEEWLCQIPKRDWIEEMCATAEQRFAE